MPTKEETLVFVSGDHQFIREFETFLKKTKIAYSKKFQHRVFRPCPEELILYVFSITAATLSIASSIIKIHDWYSKRRRKGAIEIDDVDFARYIVKSKKKCEKKRSTKKRGKTISA